jgi:hypothetical protein
MTEYLIVARAAIILWTNLAVMPAEILFDAIEAELERRSIELRFCQSHLLCELSGTHCYSYEAAAGERCRITSRRTESGDA